MPVARCRRKNAKRVAVDDGEPAARLNALRESRTIAEPHGASPVPRNSVEWDTGEVYASWPFGKFSSIYREHREQNGVPGTPPGTQKISENAYKYSVVLISIMTLFPVFPVIRPLSFYARDFTDTVRNKFPREMYTSPPATGNKLSKMSIPFGDSRCFSCSW